MLKFEDNRATIAGQGEEILLEFAKLTNALKFLIASHEEGDEEYADYLLFTAFKGGLDAPEPNRDRGAHEKPDEPKYNPTPGEDFMKMIDDLIESIKKKGD